MVFVQMTARFDRLAYRGDSRGPNEIFRTGFNTKDHPDFIMASLSEQDRASLARMPDGERLQWKHGVLETFFEAYEQGRYREAQKDFDQGSGVCCTLMANVAPMFPLLGTRTRPSTTWVYVVYVGVCFVTYSKQHADGSVLAYAQEIATQHIDHRNVICAVACSRIGRGSNPSNISHGIVFNYSADVHWNRMHCPSNLRNYAAPIVQRELTPYMNNVCWGPGTHRVHTTLQSRRLFPDVIPPPPVAAAASSGPGQTAS